MITPFDELGRVNEDLAVDLGRYLLDSGSDGLVLCATTGEGATLDREEQVSLFGAVAAELGRRGAVVASTGSNNTREACWLTERAIESGAHAVLSVTPYYNRPNRRGLMRHYTEVARAAGGRPVILYNNPARTALNMDPPMLAELAQIDGVEAVKQSNPAELQMIDALVVLSGNDDMFARCLDIGGGGGICVASHLVGEQMKRMIRDVRRRDVIDAGLGDLYRAMFLAPSPAPLKSALRMRGFSVGGVRLPLVDLDAAERDELRKVLEAHSLLGWS